MVLKPCFVYVTRVVLVSARRSSCHASLPACSGAGETDAVFALSERVSGLVETDAVPALSERSSGLAETDSSPTLLEIDAAGTGDVRRVIDSRRVCGVARAAAATAGESEGTIAMLEISESGSALVSSSSGATAGDSERIIGSCVSQVPSLSSSGCLSVHACASLSSAPASAASSRVCPVTSSAACLLLLYMRALHPYTIRVQTRYRIRCWLSGAEKCVGGARWGTGLSCRP